MHHYSLFPKKLYYFIHHISLVYDKQKSGNLKERIFWWYYPELSLITYFTHCSPELRSKHMQKSWYLRHYNYKASAVRPLNSMKHLSIFIDSFPPNTKLHQTYHQVLPSHSVFLWLRTYKTPPGDSQKIPPREHFASSVSKTAFWKIFHSLLHTRNQNVSLQIEFIDNILFLLCTMLSAILGVSDSVAMDWSSSCSQMRSPPSKISQRLV